MDPTRAETLSRAARKLVLNKRDLENVAIACYGLVLFFHVAGMVLIRLASFLLLPLLVLVRYPAQRAEDLREARRDQPTALAQGEQ